MHLINVFAPTEGAYCCQIKIRSYKEKCTVGQMSPPPLHLGLIMIKKIWWHLGGFSWISKSEEVGNVNFSFIQDASKLTAQFNIKEVMLMNAVPSMQSDRYGEREWPGSGFQNLVGSGYLGYEILSPTFSDWLAIPFF